MRSPASPRSHITRSPGHAHHASSWRGCDACACVTWYSAPRNFPCRKCLSFFCQGWQTEIFHKSLQHFVIFDPCSSPAWISMSPLYRFLLWLPRSFCLDPLIPSIFTVNDHMDHKWLGLCHTVGIIPLIYWSPLPLSTRNIIPETSYNCINLCVSESSWWLTAILWMIISSLGFLLSSHNHSSAPSLQEIFISLCVSDLAVWAVKFNLIFYCSNFSVSSYMIFWPSSLLTLSQICVINHFHSGFLCPGIVKKKNHKMTDPEHVSLKTQLLLATSSFSASCCYLEPDFFLN